MKQKIKITLNGCDDDAVCEYFASPLLIRELNKISDLLSLGGGEWSATMSIEIIDDST